MDFKDRKIIILSLCLMMCLLITLIILIVSLNTEENEVIVPKDESIILSDLIFEYYENVDILNYVSNIDIEDIDVVFDTHTLGDKTAEFRYLIDNQEYLEIVEYSVVDTTAPVIMSSNSYSIELGDEFDYTTKFVVADNYDKKAVCKIIGDYNSEVISSYELEYECSDSSDNVTSGEFILNVVEEIVVLPYSTTAVNIEDIITKHKSDTTQIGIDVSKWQGLIDYDKVVESGVEFVMIRAGYEDVNGNYLSDEYFEYNLENAKRVGLDVGVYFYSRSTNNSEAIEQAKFVLDLLDGVELELPIVFDWEVWNSFNSYNISLIDLNNMVDSFISYVEEYGYEGMNYGSANYLTKMFNNDHITWLAHYTESTYYTNDYLMWQLTDSGVVDGINSYVDLNVLYK